MADTSQDIRIRTTGAEEFNIFVRRTLLQLAFAFGVDFWTLSGRIPPERQLPRHAG